jgi:hypothetical protein
VSDFAAAHVFSEDQAAQAAISVAMRRIGEFVSTEAFQSVFAEMEALPEHLRHEFVELVWLDPRELARRRLFVPDDLQIQRSFFGDRRPTLFCVNKFLPEGLGWKRVTVTYDNQTAGSKPEFALEEDRTTFIPLIRHAYDAEAYGT